MPSWPAPSITTGKALAFCVVTPRMFPMKQVPFTFTPAHGMADTDHIIRCDDTAAGMIA